MNQREVQSRRLKLLGCTTYDDFSESKTWRDRARQFRVRYAPLQCYCCKIGDDEAEFHIHHLRYDNLGQEPDEDLIAVCIRCHGMIHEKYVGADLENLDYGHENLRQEFEEFGVY